MATKQLFTVNKTRSMGLLAMLFLLLVGTLLLMNISKRQELRKRAAAPAPDATLQLSTPVTSVNSGVLIPVTVKLVTTNTDAYGVDIKMEGIDRNVLQLESIQLGGGVTNGCTSSGSANQPAAVLAPVVNDTDTYCNFDFNRVQNKFNSTGVVEFGVAAFEWTNDNVGYPFGTSRTFDIAVINFRAGSAGSTSVKLSVPSSGSLNSSTIDTNVGAIGTQSDVGDILNLVTPGSGLQFQVADTGACALRSSGDVNCDEFVNIADINEIVKVMQSLVSPFDTDLDGNGFTNIADINIVVQTMLAQ